MRTCEEIVADGSRLLALLSRRMSADLKANPSDGISRESERNGSASEVARASPRLPEEREEQVMALRQALIEGENTGEADELDM